MNYFGTAPRIETSADEASQSSLDYAATQTMICEYRDTLKRMFEHVEDMNIERGIKKMALREIMMALITVIHGESR
jgi:hypothetical protein